MGAAQVGEQAFQLGTLRVDRDAQRGVEQPADVTGPVIDGRAGQPAEGDPDLVTALDHPRQLLAQREHVQLPDRQGTAVVCLSGVLEGVEGGADPFVFRLVVGQDAGCGDRPGGYRMLAQHL